MRVETFGQGCLGYVREGAIWFYEGVKDSKVIAIDSDIIAHHSSTRRLTDTK